MPFAQYRSNGGSSRWGRASSSSSKDPYSQEALEKQIENAKIRIKDSGFEPEQKDTKWYDVWGHVENATNLPKDQNAFFDVLELIGRPGSAVLNAIDKGIDGGDVGEAAWRGFAGHDRITGSDFAQDKLGIDNKVGKFTAGLAIDIATDPTNLIPGGMIVKGASKVGNVGKTAYKGIENAITPLKTARETTQEILSPSYNVLKEKLGKAFVYQSGWDKTLSGETDDTLKRLFNDTTNKIGYQSEEALRDVIQNAKNTGLEAGEQVGRLMEKDLKQFIPKTAFNLPDGRLTENYGDLYKYQNDMKSAIRDKGKALKDQSKQYKQAESSLREGLMKTNKEIDKLYFGLEKNVKGDLLQGLKTNLKGAKSEIKSIDGQLLGLDKTVKSLQKYNERLVKESHEMNFDLIKQLKEVAPQGIKGLPKKELPSVAWPLVRNTGKAIDEVANELGYKYADDLVQDIKKLNGIPRKLDNSTVASIAAKQVENSGYLKEIESQKQSLLQAKGTMETSLKETSVSSDEVLEGSFKELADHPEYKHLKQQKDILSKQIKDISDEVINTRKLGVNEIKELQAIIKQVDEFKKDPVTIQKLHERPTRDMPTDPKVQQAADNLMKSNQMIRDMAESNGVSVRELEGYMKHVLSAEERKARKTGKTVPIDRGNNGAGQPNKKILNSRELLGSAEDVNEQVGRKLFEPNAYFATAIGQKQLIEYVHAVSFRRQILSNSNFAVKYEKGMDVPSGSIKIDTNNYTFMKGDAFDNTGLADEIGGEYIVTKGAKEALDRYQKLTTDEGVQGVLKVIDTLQNFWKRFALFSVPYHVRNDIGAKFNNWVGGMNEVDLMKYSAAADKELFNVLTKGQESDLFKEYRKQGLSSSNLSKVEFKYNEEPEEAITKAIEEGSKTNLQKLNDRFNPLSKNWKRGFVNWGAFGRAFETSREIGDVIDQSNRYALFKWAVEKQKMTPEQAAAKVREIQFDYTRTTVAEREVFSRLVPFYRWMRNNLPYQAKQFIYDPRKYNNLNKVRENAQSTVGIDEENVPNWMKESFALPVYGDDQGSGKFLSMNLPAADLTKLSQPMKLGVDSLSPLIKTPIEYVSNRNLFYNKPIEKFEGQEKKFQLGNMEWGVPSKVAHVIEQSTGQIGRGFSQYLQKPEEEDLDTKFRMPSLGISSMTKDFDVEKARIYELLNELQKLQDQMKYIEQETGLKPRMLKDIQN